MKYFTLLVLVLLTHTTFAQGNVKSTNQLLKSNTPPVEQLESGTDEQKKELRKKRRQQLSKDLRDVISIELYGGGALLGIITADENTDETINPSGNIGLNFRTNRLSCNFYYSYNGKNNIQVNNLSVFGNILSNPNRTGQSASFSVLARFSKSWGLSGSFTAVNNIWEVDNGTTVDASPIYGAIGLYLRPFNFESEGDNTIDFLCKAHFTHRSILGDFSKADQLIDSNIIKNRGYNGFEFSTNLLLNSVEMFVKYTYNEVDDLDIPGFSQSQIVFGVNVTGDLIKIK